MEARSIKGPTPAAPREVKASRLILVVEDDEELRDLLTQTIEGLGYAVETASHGLKAIDHVRRRRPDLVLFDLQMPVCDGVRLHEELVALSFPVERLVLMSAADDGRRRASSMGVRFLKKPFDVDQLREALER
ncbi:MAG: response regulator [Myxococcales bacterium]|nr:response regulator [Myxococcales bacterium]